MRRCIYAFCRLVAPRRNGRDGFVGPVHRPIICNGFENSGRNMYPRPLAAGDDARSGRGAAATEGPRAHADRPGAPLEREPVDDREDREAADEPLVRRRPAGHGVPPGRAEATGEKGARRTDPDEEGPIRRGEDSARHRCGRDAPLEVLSDARYAQRSPHRLDLGQGDQQPHPLRQGPEGPRADPGGRGHGAGLPRSTQRPRSSSPRACCGTTTPSS